MNRIQHTLTNVIKIGICVTLALGAFNRESNAQEEHGLKVGQKAPTFMLKNQSEKDLSLAEILKKGPVALVFYRSADW